MRRSVAQNFFTILEVAHMYLFQMLYDINYGNWYPRSLMLIKFLLTFDFEGQQLNGLELLLEKMTKFEFDTQFR